MRQFIVNSWMMLLMLSAGILSASAQKPGELLNQFEHNLRNAKPTELYTQLKQLFYFGNGSFVNERSWIESLKSVQSEKDLPTISQIVKEAVAKSSSFRLFRTLGVEDVPGRDELKVLNVKVNYDAIQHTPTMKTIYANWRSQGIPENELQRRGMMSIVALTMPTLDPSSKVSHEIVSPYYAMPAKTDRKFDELRILVLRNDSQNWVIVGHDPLP
jgi:hypothetical protein